MTKNKLTSLVSQLFDLTEDTEFVETDISIRKNVDFKSANAWTLVFAIFIASVGLNINSTAVIIGAMLISPLMGPIVGLGYSLGVNDFTLLNRALRNLLIAVGISLITSTIYFVLSPLTDAQSELLARTSPTFYDVLIALFGGATGIVAMSRKEKSNAIPGVAIATALMPPLCTAGYGLATLHFNYFFGAMFLFIINSVFIAISTYVFVRVLHFTKVKYPDLSKQKLIDRWVMFGAAVVIIPSLILAWFLMAETSFRTRANSFIETEFDFPSTVVVEKKVNYKPNEQSILVTVVGDSISANEVSLLKEKMKRYKLDPSSLQLKQLSFEERINKKLQQQRLANDQISLFEMKTKTLQSRLDLIEKDSKALKAISNELSIFSPKTKELLIFGGGYGLVWKSKPIKKEKKMVEDFLRQRLDRPELVLNHLGNF